MLLVSTALALVAGLTVDSRWRGFSQALERLHGEGESIRPMEHVLSQYGQSVLLGPTAAATGRACLPTPEELHASVGDHLTLGGGWERNLDRAYEGLRKTAEEISKSAFSVSAFPTQHSSLEEVLVHLHGVEGRLHLPSKELVTSWVIKLLAAAGDRELVVEELGLSQDDTQWDVSIVFLGTVGEEPFTIPIDGVIPLRARLESVVQFVEKSDELKKHVLDLKLLRDELRPGGVGEGFASSTLEQARRDLPGKILESGPKISLAGIPIPNSLIGLGLPLAILLVLLGLLGGTRELRRSAPDLSGSEVAWQFLYSSQSDYWVSLLSVSLVPLVAVSFLLLRLLTAMNRQAGALEWVAYVMYASVALIASAKIGQDVWTLRTRTGAGQRASPGDVYVSRLGRCYHLPGCRWLSAEHVVVPRGVALSLRYESCEHCTGSKEQQKGVEGS